jgi:hypothetical protein
MDLTMSVQPSETIIMDLPTLPPKHPELVELEQRHRAIRAQQTEIENQLKKVRTAWARASVGDSLDDVAELIADGKLTEVGASNLPARQADLENQLDALNRGGQKLWERLARERTRHENQIIRAFRPAHMAAVQQIAQAVEALIAANKAEEAVRAACPVQLVSLTFPNIGTMSVNRPGSARYWRQYAERLGFFDDDEPAPAPGRKTRRKLFASKANGTTGEPLPLAAKGVD